MAAGAAVASANTQAATSSAYAAGVATGSANAAAATASAYNAGVATGAAMASTPASGTFVMGMGYAALPAGSMSHQQERRHLLPERQHLVPAGLRRERRLLHRRAGALTRAESGAE